MGGTPGLLKNQLHSTCETPKLYGRLVLGAHGRGCEMVALRFKEHLDHGMSPEGGRYGLDQSSGFRTHGFKVQRS